jgi:hypothetical protein
MMAKKWTLDDLRQKSVHERAALYENACRLGHTPDGAALKELIEEAGLPYSEDSCLSMDDPITIKMHDIIQSQEGREAALSATKMGQPAMAGIDPLLQVALGSDYGAHNMGTATAGGLVGELMHSLGFKKIGQKPLPANCVAKTAAMWG